MPSSSSPELRTIAQFGTHVSVLEEIADNPNATVNRHIPKNRLHELSRYNEIDFLSHHHPGLIKILKRIKRSDGSSDYHLEYMDAMDLMHWLPKFHSENRTYVALSVIKQLLPALLFLQVFTKKPHRNVCPQTILLRRNGTIKLTIPDLLSETLIVDNLSIYMNTPYCPPECTTPDLLLNSDSKTDVWALGVLVLAMMWGRPLQPRQEPQRADEALPPQVDEIQQRKYEEEVKMFRKLLSEQNDDAWAKVIPDSQLRQLTRMCLQKDPQKRISLKDANALILLLGGIDNNPLTFIFDAENKNTIEPFPWATHAESLSGEKTLTEFALGHQLQQILESDKTPDTLGKIAARLQSELVSWKKKRLALPSRSTLDIPFRKVFTFRNLNSQITLKNILIRTKKQNNEANIMEAPVEPISLENTPFSFFYSFKFLAYLSLISTLSFIVGILALTAILAIPVNLAIGATIGGALGLAGSMGLMTFKFFKERDIREIKDDFALDLANNP